MSEAEKATIGTVLFNGLVVLIPLLFTLMTALVGWLVSRVHSNEKSSEKTATKLAAITNGEGIEKIIAVVTQQQQQGKIPLGSVAQTPAIEPELKPKREEGE